MDVMDLQKNTHYTNIPIALSFLHVKEYANVVKRKDRTNRRTSSESNSVCNASHMTNLSVKTARQFIRTALSSMESAQPLSH